MHVNKKLGRFRQFVGEKLGNENKTGVSDDFKALEMEMQLRHEGMDKMQRAMTVYIKSLSKRAEGDDREKTLPGGHMGSSMVTHSEDFEPDSEFGMCLSSLGRANERLARVQETYVQSATSSWLEGLERSLAQMKEYQNARKKLEQRRLAYDASLAKVQKAKKEDFRVEEELRSQKAKYDESSEDVYRRMQDIKEQEVDMIQDLSSFLEAELTYYDRCREILLNVKRDWPVRESATTRSRSRSVTAHTAHSYAERFNPPEEEPPVEPPRITIPKLSNRNMSPAHGASSPGGYSSRPAYSRQSTFDGSSRAQREESPARRLSRIPTEPTAVLTGRSNLRPVRQANTFSEEYDDEYNASNGHRRERSPSPAASSQGSVLSRAASWTATDMPVNGKKVPPPPPPSRAKKPPPPPPPMKRSGLSASEVSHY